MTNAHQSPEAASHSSKSTGTNQHARTHEVVTDARLHTTPQLLLVCDLSSVFSAQPPVMLLHFGITSASHFLRRALSSSHFYFRESHAIKCLTPGAEVCVRSNILKGGNTSLDYASDTDDLFVRNLSSLECPHVAITSRCSL